MIEHEDHCPEKGDRRCDCDYEARVRADERAKVGTEANAVVRQKDERIADLLEDLDTTRADERARMADYLDSIGCDNAAWFVRRIARSGGRDE